MPLLPTLLPTRQLETACADGACERRHSHRLARRNRNAVSAADQDRPSSPARQGEGIDGRQRRARRPGTRKVVIHVEHRERQLSSLRLRYQRVPPTTTATPHHGRSPIALPHRVLPWRRRAILPTSFAERLQHAHFGNLLHGPKQPPMGRRPVTRLISLSAA